MPVTRKIKSALAFVSLMCVLAGGLTVSAPAIRKIELEGLKRTAADFIRSKLLHSRDGEFSRELWERERRVLMDYDIFADIRCRVTSDEEGEVLVYSFQELPAFLIFPAMKRTDQDGLLMGPGLAIMNFFGLPIHQEFLWRMTVAPEPLRANEMLYYIWVPEIFSVPVQAEFEVEYFDSYNALKLFEERSYYGMANIIYRCAGNLHILLSGSTVWMRHDDSSPALEADGQMISMFLGEGEWDFLPAAGIGLIHDARERLMNPHSGLYNALSVSVAGGKLGGDGDFWVVRHDFRAYIPAGERHILHANALTRFRPGTIPGYELYHIGGVNSLRSFQPDPDICGQHEVLATLEYRFEFFANRQISLFGMHGYYGLQAVIGNDHAFYWLPDDSFDEGRHLSSVFIGLHLLVPVLDRVRVEFGCNGYDRADRSIRFGLNVGWYEKAYTQGRRVR